MLDQLVTKTGKLSSIEVRQLALEVYETYFGIFRTEVEDNPLDIILMHEAENPYSGSLVFERMEQFATYKVGTHFNISWPAFMDLPTVYCDKLLEIAKRLQNNQQAAVDNLLSGMPGA